jgi:hypothetical protein
MSARETGIGDHDVDTAANRRNITKGMMARPSRMRFKQKGSIKIAARPVNGA